MLNHTKPTYQKLREDIANAILDGTHSEGDRLPSVRSLAAAEGANPLTVAKAYQIFQEQELIIVHRGVGMFVAKGAYTRLQALMREDFMTNIWPGVARQIRRFGIEPKELLEDIDGST